MRFTKEIKHDAIIVRHSGFGTYSHLFVSDKHLDSNHFDITASKRLMQQAVDDGAGIFIIGDLFDAMGHNMDKRTTKSDIKNVHNVANYFGSIVDEGVKLLAPYAANIVMISKGNHEASVLKRHEVDLLSMLKYKLDHETGSNVFIGDYHGWVRFNFQDGVGNRSSKTLYYTHGKGGNAPMTMGALNVRRRQSIIDADIIVSGHIHQAYAIPFNKYRLTEQGKERIEETLHLQLGTFEDSNEWSRGLEHAPPSKCGYWVDFSYSTREINILERRAK